MVFEKIREIIAEQTGKDVDEITLETNVKEDLDADSLDLFQIINDIEDEFDVSVEDPESIVTVQDAVDFVESHKNYSKRLYSYNWVVALEVDNYIRLPALSLYFFM